MDLYALVGQQLADPAPWSDLHLHVGLPPRVRAADMSLHLLSATSISDADFAAFAERIRKGWADDLRKTQGNLDCSVAVQGSTGGAVRFRANFCWQSGRPGLVLRRIATQVPSLEGLGLPAVVAQLGNQASGLLLFTGVTGSGKSTSMASLLMRIARQGVNIITLEDPVEYVLASADSQVLQRAIGDDCPSFAAGLRAALRQDPDVIMVGEIRDPETAELALTAAQTGHLVLATLHTRSAVHTADRLVTLFPAAARDDVRMQIAGSLLGIVSQLLLPRTDGLGRVLAAEVMVNTPAVAAVLREGKHQQLANQIRQDRQHGSQLLNAALADLVRAGRISREQALLAAYDRTGFEDEMR